MEKIIKIVREPIKNKKAKEIVVKENQISYTNWDKEKRKLR
jgi:hypothetical protein